MSAHSTSTLARGTALAGFLAALALTLIPGLAWAQQVAASWPAVLEAAKKEGRVVVYAGPTQPVMDRLGNGFKKAYPDIVIEINRGPSGQLLSKVDQERTTGADGADVFISTEAGWYFARAKEGKLLKPVGPALKGWPAKYIDQGSIVGAGIQFQGLAYNKNLVRNNPPKGYADLLRPEFKGRIGTSTLASTFLMGWYDWLEKTEGPGFLAKLREQNPKIYEGSAPGAQAVASGEISVSALVTYASTRQLILDGAPMVFVAPSPAMGQAFRLSALAWSKRPNAALVFTDYVMSRDGQTAWHGTGESSSPLAGIPGAAQLPANVTLWNAEDWPPEAVKAYRERWDKIFK